MSDSCSIIGNEKDGLALRELMLNKRRLNPYDSIEEWPNGDIPFVVSDSINDFKWDIFYEAINEYNMHTKIRWRNKTDSDTHWVLITNNAGCSAYVGNIQSSLSPQTMSLGSECQTFNIMVHEMGHVIGLYHTHARIDRDNWVSYYIFCVHYQV